MEGKSGPPPKFIVPPLPAYLVLFSVMAYWCYYGWQYNKKHFPVSLTDILVFFGVFLIPFLATMIFREFNRRIGMYPLLKRLAVLRPGAFVVVEGSFPSLLYARSTWIGEVTFEEGSEEQSAFTRVDARIVTTHDWVEIRKKGIFDKFGRRSEECLLTPQPSAFNKQFLVSGPDREFIRDFLSPAISEAIMRIAEVGNPLVTVSHNSVRVEVEKDLSKARREDMLRQFLTDAETIIERAAQDPSRL